MGLGTPRAVTLMTGHVPCTDPGSCADAVVTGDTDPYGACIF